MPKYDGSMFLLFIISSTANVDHANRRDADDRPPLAHARS
jgi:hypothetical protein